MTRDIPNNRPKTPLLDQIHNPEYLRSLTHQELPQLACELREFLLYSVGQTGGHFGAGLGVIELTIALHYLLHTPYDRLVWDVGHQAYPHKILTERKERMHTIRQKDGLAAFPKREESIFDTFGVGHSSTSISAALGMAIAAQIKNESRKVVAVIGDGAMTAGMAYEALNHAAGTKANLLVILNDNDMSISRNVGGLSNYLARILSSKTYKHVKEGSKKVLSNIPNACTLANRTETHIKGMVIPGTLFEELGFNYIGPIDGHDLSMLIDTLKNVINLEGPQLLHIVTCKGKGFCPAEEDPIGYHAINKIEAIKTTKTKPKYANIFGEWLCDMAQVSPSLIGITPAMKEGSDLIKFAQQFPHRYFDTAIAEQHAVTFAAGLACENMKPVVAIYSTFLQRAYDQLIHDVALQNLDVLFAIDRAGLVGEDGPTHGGCYDIAYLRCIPNLMIMTPSDEQEMRSLLSTGFLHPGPAAIRYPRGEGLGVKITNDLEPVSVGKGVIRRQGHRVALLVFGPLLSEALKVADILDATVVSMRFVSPLDTSLVHEMSQTHDLLVTIEDGTIAGGAGSAVLEYLHANMIQAPVFILGIPAVFIEAASRQQQLAECGLDSHSMVTSIKNRLHNLTHASKLQEVVAIK